MRIASVLAGLMLALATTSALARRSPCRQVVCECPAVVRCSPDVCPKAVCGKLAIESCIPQPTVVAFEPGAVPAVAPNHPDDETTSAKRSRPQSTGNVDAKRDADRASRKEASKLDACLADWEKASSKIRRLDCEFQRFGYDPNFEVEKRGQGTLSLDRDGRAKYRIVPAAVTQGDASKRKGTDGNLYKLEACSAECWHWTGPQLFKLDDQEHLYETINLPPRGGPDSTGYFQFMEQLKELPLAKPFFLGLPAKQLKGRFKIKVMKESDDELWLQLIPRREEDSGNLQKAVLILDRQRWLPRAIKMIDPTGCETVHVFQKVKVNSAEGDDLSKPNLEGYRQVLSEKPPKTEKTLK